LGCTEAAVRCVARNVAALSALSALSAVADMGTDMLADIAVAVSLVVHRCVHSPSDPVRLGIALRFATPSELSRVVLIARHFGAVVQNSQPRDWDTEHILIFSNRA
jgi:hypothetical protein